MCGISGAVAVAGRTSIDRLTNAAAAAASALSHRGPDASGTWADGRSVALAHRRLSIVDLSEAGAQPMASSDGRWVITYNGELYNADEMWARLGLSQRRGHSDTEVLVEAIARLGIERCLDEVVGMFAFGAWDRAERRLWLARDRLGEKPLYYASRRDRFVFASELRAIDAALQATPEIDRDAIRELLRHHYISAPRTIYREVCQLPPGTYLSVADGRPSTPVRYWNPVTVAHNTPRRPIRGAAAVDELEELLERAVRARMVSDVPLGAFLSGGTDSATIVAMMERVRPGTRTFTIGFEDQALDESAVARRTADVLGTIHEELILTGSDALAVVPKLARIYGEPFADSSQIPTYLVSEFTRRHVTVALSGDGGDEMFGGYERYRYFERLLRARRLPVGLRRAMAAGAEAIPADALEWVAQSRLGEVLPRAVRNRPTTRARKMAMMLRATSECELYTTMRSVTDDAWDVVLGDGQDQDRAICESVSHLSSTELAMMVDTLDYLPNDILTKVDRAAMAVSLETRVPFLDPDVFRFAWSIAPEDRVRDGQGKWLIRQLLARHVPKDITELPKRGFGVPLDAWLRGPLRAWAAELIDPALVAEQGLLDAAVVQRLWARHQSGREQLGPQLWPIVMFQAWLHDR
jgi:asparagine synthase (glutamine-hydrolysing)